MLGKKPDAQGYEEGLSVLHKRASVVEFVKAKDPVDMLSRYNQFHFEDEEAEKYVSCHNATLIIKVSIPSSNYTRNSGPLSGFEIT